MLYWSERTNDAAQMLQEEINRGALATTDVPTELQYGWIYKTVDDLVQELFGAFSRATVHRATVDVIDRGWVVARAAGGMNRTRALRVDVVKIMQDVCDLGFHLTGYPAVRTVSARLQPSPPISHGETCISHGETSISHGETCISQGETCISHGETSISHGETCISQGETCIYKELEITTEITTEITEARPTDLNQWQPATGITLKPIPNPRRSFPARANSPIGDILAHYSMQPRADITEGQILGYWDIFKSHYPNRSGSDDRARARERFILHVTAGHDPREMIFGLINWRDSLSVGTIGTNFVPMMVTWLNQTRWLGFLEENQPASLFAEEQTMARALMQVQ